MALVKKQMTPEQFAKLQLDIAARLGNVRPLMKKYGKRYQGTSRRNLRQGQQATGKHGVSLSRATIDSQAVAEDDRTQLGKRSSFGNVPLKVTNKMVRGLVYVVIRNGFMLLNKTSNRGEVSAWQAKDTRIRVTKAMQRHLAGVHNIMVKVGTVLFRQARVPFALNSRQVKRSVTELNRYILNSLFG